MYVKQTKVIFLAFICMLYGVNVMAQLSPGDLTEAHAHLEGLSNCTQCHILGEKVANEKCLACHTSLKKRVDQKTGYHSSSDVKGKECTICHNDHHGRKFRIIRFDTASFDHTLAGYKLEGKHADQACTKCHKKENITDPEVDSKKFTYLGLGKKCLNCHTDFHQQTLSSTCSDCHSFNRFKPAEKFDHQNAKFALVGKHKEIDCAKCHKKEVRNGKDFQVFKGIAFANCNDCHTDPHKNKFGGDCVKCHNENSFHQIAGISSFDHNKTNFRLEGKHRLVKCSKCHKTKYTDPVKHARCLDCHNDYHQSQFAKQGKVPDCSECHNVNGFAGSSFTIEKHNQSNFALKGAHMATPCFVCHKKEDKWNFRNLGLQCNDCHTNIHKDIISEKYYPEADCKTCHSEESWKKITTFDHKQTKFELTGAHLQPNCRECHFKEVNGNIVQHFKDLPTDCNECHADIHRKQFEVNGIVDCSRCHAPEKWKPSNFDHNKARFKLDGKHRDVACAKCHKTAISGELTYIKYKMEDFRCEACHH